MKTRKLVAGALAAAMVAGSLAGCYIGGDTSWCAKVGDKSLPAGVYIYELYSAYSEAQQKANSSDMKAAEVDGKDAFQWITERAKALTCQNFLLDDKMKALKLSFTDAEKKEIEQLSGSAWSQMSSVLEPKHVAPSSFKIAYAESAYKQQKVFKAIYGKGGEKEISEAEQRKYFEEKYTDYAYMYVPLTKEVSSTASVASGSSAASGPIAMTAAEKAAVKKEMDAYLHDINAGKKTVSQVATEYASKHGGDSSLQELTEIMDDSNSTSSMLPQELTDAVKQMKAGESRLLEVSSTNYVLVSKYDIKKKTDAFLKDEDKRFQVLFGLKGTAFTDELTKEAKAYKGVTWNDKTLSENTPELFYEAPVSSAAASGAASTASGASSTASSSASGASSSASTPASSAVSKASK